MALLGHDFVQQALIAAALLGLVAGLIGPFIVMRQMSFAVHGSSELSLTGAAFALLVMSLLITPAAAAARLVASPAAIAASVVFAEISAVGGIVLSLAPGVPVSVFVATISFLIYLFAGYSGGGGRPPLKLVAQGGPRTRGGRGGNIAPANSRPAAGRDVHTRHRLHHHSQRKARRR